MSRLDYTDVSSIMLEDARHDECIGLPAVINTRIALGAGPVGLGVACAYCAPSLVTAHLYRGGLPCCRECFVTNSKPRVPAFVLRAA